MTLSAKHATRDICPRCHIRFITHLHCPNRGCTYHLHVCEACDRTEAAERVLGDHVDDCEFQPPTAPFVRIDVRAA